MRQHGAVYEGTPSGARRGVSRQRALLLRPPTRLVNVVSGASHGMLLVGNAIRYPICSEASKPLRRPHRTAAALPAYSGVCADVDQGHILCSQPSSLRPTSRD